jgi:transcriptional accessory protein Tex/SPT6
MTVTFPISSTTAAPGRRWGSIQAIAPGLVATSVIYPHEPQRQWNEALAVLSRLAVQHKVQLIAIARCFPPSCTAPTG